jgi:hypothetical protein
MGANIPHQIHNERNEYKCTEKRDECIVQRCYLQWNETKWFESIEGCSVALRGFGWCSQAAGSSFIRSNTEWVSGEPMLLCWMRSSGAYIYISVMDVRWMIRWFPWICHLSGCRRCDASATGLHSPQAIDEVLPAARSWLRTPGTWDQDVVIRLQVRRYGMWTNSQIFLGSPLINRLLWSTRLRLLFHSVPSFIF